MSGEPDQAGAKSLTIDDLALTNRAYNCLRRERIVHVFNLVAKTREELLIHDLDICDSTTLRKMAGLNFTLMLVILNR